MNILNRKLLLVVVAAAVLTLQIPALFAQYVPTTFNKGGGGGGPAVVRSCGNNTSSDVSSVTVTCTVPAGDWIECLGGYDSTATVVCSDSASDTFSTPSHSSSGTNSVFESHASSASGATSVTATFTGTTTFCTCMVLVVSNVTGVDVGPSVGTPTASGTSYSWNSITSTHADALFIAFGSSASVNNTYTAGGSYVIPTGTCSTTGTCGQMSGGNQSALVETFSPGTAGVQTPTAAGTTSLALANLDLALYQ